MIQTPRKTSQGVGMDSGRQSQDAAGAHPPPAGPVTGGGSYDAGADGTRAPALSRAEPRPAADAAPETVRDAAPDAATDMLSDDADFELADAPEAPSVWAEPSGPTPGELAVGGFDLGRRGAADGRMLTLPLIVAALGTAVLLAMIGLRDAGGAPVLPPVLLLVIASAVQWGAGWPLHRAAVDEARRLRVGPLVVLTLASTAGWTHSAWRWVAEGEAAGVGLAPLAALLVTLALLGRSLRVSADPRPGAHVDGPPLDPPAMARRRGGPDAAGDLVPVADLGAGATILLRAGEVVPVDATVIAGVVEILTRPVTGDPVPRTCRQGAKVFAGSPVLSGAAEARVEEVGVQSLLGEAGALARAVPARQGQGGQGEVRLARWSLAVALVLAPVFGLAAGLGEPARGVQAALAVFALAYPAGLALYRPMSHAIAARLAHAQGVRLHDLDASLGARRIAHLCFGWRGLMTPGRYAVGPVSTEDDVTEAEALSLARAVVGRIEHPLAEALAVAADRAGSDLRQASERRGDPDRGYVGEVAGRTILLGTPALLSAHRVGYRRFSDQAAVWANEGYQVLWLAEAGARRRALALIGLGDRPRAPFLYSLEALKAEGIQATVLMPQPEALEADWVGDNSSLGALGGRPGRRLEEMEGLRRQYGPTAAMVSSVSDLALMRTADLAIAAADAPAPVRRAADLTVGPGTPEHLLATLTWAKRFGARGTQVLWALLVINGMAMFLVPAGLFAPAVGVAAALLSVLAPLAGLLLARP
ncbi:hypothetical protein CKO24_01160 [Rhodothalassium salexigens DSM 2132]|nr:hypothetical protein [Rhodothalassium salexigens DSM 2132]